MKGPLLNLLKNFGTKSPQLDHKKQFYSYAEVGIIPQTTKRLNTFTTKINLKILKKDPTILRRKSNYSALNQEPQERNPTEKSSPIIKERSLQG